MREAMRPGPGRKGAFAPYSCCFDCCAPQSICAKWEVREEQGGKWHRTSRACQFKDIIIPVVVSLMAEGEDALQDMFKEWIGGFGVDIHNGEEMYKWLGQKVQWGRVELTRLVELFHRFRDV